jgi:hypothetical protein
VSCQIIPLANRRKARRRISIRSGNPLLDDQGDILSIEMDPAAPRIRSQDGISETLKNRNLRDARKSSWRSAEVKRQYWRARLDMESAIDNAQSRELPEGDNHPPHDRNERWTLLAHWRLSIVAQILTPSPDTRAIAWKKAALEDRQWQYTDLAREHIERAIADDVAFLASHPTRTKKTST